MDLPAVRNSTPRPPTTPALSQRLTWLLTSSTSADEAIAEINSDPTLFREAQAALPALRREALDQAGPGGVKIVIGRRFALFPQPERSDGEWAMWWADYVEALQALPTGALEAAMAAYVKQDGAEFMPKPGKLLALAKTTPNRGAQAYDRALRATNTSAPAEGPATTRPAPTDRDRAAVKALLASFKASVSEHDRPRASSNTRSTAGTPDAGGLTPKMREMIARRQADGEA
jgi:hypothetical protein